MSVRIVTESTSDLRKEDQQKWNVTVLPLPIRFGDKEYKSGEDLSNHQFYDLLVESTVFPKTSQVSPFAYKEAVEKVLSQGDEVLLISISSQLSGCYQNAKQVADSYDERVQAVDSQSASIGQFTLIAYAAELIEKGWSLSQVVAELERVKPKMRILALVDTLDYLLKGGRISKTVAIAGRLLGIKPIISLRNGAIILAGKARGSKAGHQHLIKLIHKMGGLDFSMPICAGHSGNSDEKLQQYLKESEDIFEGHVKDATQVQMGTAIGSYSGPNAIGIGWFSKE